MTPQTLINDLSRENCDPSSIILLVVGRSVHCPVLLLLKFSLDEAHKGKGDYAYAQVVRFMMAKNPHFRLLALTATPGSTPDAVQEIVDSLHISHIEIRDEESIDLRQYMFKKVGSRLFITDLLV
jgi:ATP-dependent DNA helicase MPH1